MSDSLADQKKRLLEAVAIADQDFVDAHNALQWAQRIADEKHARQRRAAGEYAVWMLTQEHAAMEQARGQFDTTDLSDDSDCETRAEGAVREPATTDPLTAEQEFSDSCVVKGR